MGAALCNEECLAASPACTHWIPEALPNPQDVTAKMSLYPAECPLGRITGQQKLSVLALIL